MKKQISLCCFVLIFCTGLVFAQQIHLIPEPVKQVAKSGVFTLDKDVKLVAEKSLQQQAAFLAERLQDDFEIALPLVEKISNEEKMIRLEIVAGKFENPEGYSLVIEPQKIVIHASDARGVFYGIQSLRQIVFDKFNAKSQNAELPCLEIEDYPQFVWRGLMLDVSRTFFHVNLVKRYIDLMAYYKLNTLHWHLTDDQGWRIEIKKYPRLTQIGSKFRAEDNVMGGYYSQEEIKDIVRYAAERNITIVPEIEMPGHSMATIVSYPELTCPVVDKNTLAIHEFLKGKNIHSEILCAGNEAVYEFMDNVLEEVCSLFPSQYVHIGGDEAAKQFWKECPLCQKTIADNKLANENALQGYFVERILKMLEKRGKTLIGWDEILVDSKLPSHVVGMYWRDRENKGVGRFVKEGHKVIATPRHPCYLDYDYKRNSTQNIYEYNPIADDGYSPEAKANVLGVQASFWSHIEHNEVRIDRMIFPRLLAMAATAWASPEKKNWAQFQQKLESHKKYLDKKNVDYFNEE